MVTTYGRGNTTSASYRVWAACALILLGAVLRLGFFYLDTQFWGDEAALALNLRTRTFSQLFTPLDYDQHAPLFFVLLEKGVFDVLGSSEHALRLPALAASLLSLPLFFCWMRRSTAPGDVCLIGLTFFTLNPQLIYYSAQMKPYAVDVLSTLLVCLCGLGLRKNEFGWKWLAFFALIGGLLIWVSFPVVFVLAGVAFALIWTEWNRGRRLNSRLVLLPMLVWGVSLLCNHFLITRHSIANQRLLDYWQTEHAFASFLPKSPRDLRALVALFLRPFADPLGGSSNVLIGVPAILWLVGLVRLLRRDPITAGFCTVPLALTFVVSGMHLYPFSGRLILFLIPLLLIPVAWGVASLRSDPTDRVTVPAATAFLLFSYAILMNDICRNDFNRASVGHALNRIAQSHQPNDVLYVFHSGGYRTFLWYRQAYSLNDMAIMHGSPNRPEKSILEADLARMRTQRRLWLLFPELHERRFTERDAILAALDVLGRRLDEFHENATHVVLYELGPTTKSIGQL